MKIAIIGAGFSGLSAAYFLSHSNMSASITLYDFRGIAKGASGKASGLLHPYAGKRANFSYKAELAFPEASALIHAIHEHSVRTTNLPVILQKGILRPAVLESQKRDFQARAQESYPIESLYLTCEESSKYFPNPLNLPSLYIPSGLAIDSVQYLTTLFNMCREKGMIFQQEKIHSLHSLLGQYDHVICAGGYETKLLVPEKKELHTNDVKGQRLDIELPSEFSIPSIALAGTAYAAFSHETHLQPAKVCLGSTYEHHFDSDLPDEPYAKKEIFSKIAMFWPQLLSYPIHSIDAGIRATTPTSKPIVSFFHPKIWAITGLGSKGLLYHAWLSKLVVKAITGSISHDDVASTLSSSIFSHTA